MNNVTHYEICWIHVWSKKVNVTRFHFTKKKKKIVYMTRENEPVWSKDIYMFGRRRPTTRSFVNKSNGDFFGTIRIFPLQDQTLIREVANFDPLYLFMFLEEEYGCSFA